MTPQDRVFLEWHGHETKLRMRKALTHHNSEDLTPECLRPMERLPLAKPDRPGGCKSATASANAMGTATATVPTFIWAPASMNASPAIVEATPATFLSNQAAWSLNTSPTASVVGNPPERRCAGTLVLSLFPHRIT